MGSLVESLIELVAGIWRADSELRDNSVFGQSEEDRQNRKWVGWLCGGLILVVVIAGVVWCWFSQ